MYYSIDGGDNMLSQKEADALINELKEIRDLSGPITFPQPGHYQRLDLISTDGRHSFVVDVNRWGT